MRLSNDVAKVIDHLYRHRDTNYRLPDELWTKPLGRQHRELFFAEFRDRWVPPPAAVRRWKVALQELKDVGFVWRGVASQVSFGWRRPKPSL
jgi:hypothetical protein